MEVQLGLAALDGGDIEGAFKKVITVERKAFIGHLKCMYMYIIMMIIVAIIIILYLPTCQAGAECSFKRERSFCFTFCCLCLSSLDEFV